MHLNTCPLQPYIPVYLIVTGVLSMASLLLIYIRTAMIDESLLRFMCSLCLYLIIIFNFCWFISGAHVGVCVCASNHWIRIRVKVTEQRRDTPESNILGCHSYTNIINIYSFVLCCTHV